MSLPLPLRAAWRHWRTPSISKWYWLATYLAFSTAFFILASPFVAYSLRIILDPDRAAVFTDSLVVFLCAESFLLCYLWLELPRTRRLEAALHRIHSTQRALSLASGRIVNLTPGELEPGLNRELCAIRELLDIDGVSWFERAEDGRSYVRVQSALAATHGPAFPSLLGSELPWIADKLLHGSPALIGSIDDLPRDAVRERKLLEMGRIRSLALIPSSGASSGQNALVLTSFANKIAWGEEVIAQLTVFATVFANAKARKLAEDAGEESELRYRHLFEDSPLGLALLDTAGNIRVANGALAGFLGRTMVELTSQSIFGMTCGDEMPQAWLQLQELLAGVPEIRQVDRKFLRKDGNAVLGRITLSMAGGRSGEGRFVLATVEDVTETASAREQLGRSSHMLALALEAARMKAWEYKPDTDTMTWIDRNKTIQVADQPPASDQFSNILKHVVPDDRALLLGLIKKMLETGGSFCTEFRMIGRDGSIRWMLGKGELSRGASGDTPTIVGVTVDISHLKQAQIDLQQLAKKLMEAQEEERKRISLELHDDIGQRVAMLAIELDLVRHLLDDNRVVQNRVTRAQIAAEELGTDLQLLSRTLHSSKLKYLGLPAAIREFCNRISEMRLVTVELDCTEQRPALTEDESLALFRVAQEALNNVVRHSKAARAKVTLAVTETFLTLSVHDDGVGFSDTSTSNGIGLIGMRERIRSIGGEFKVLSTPGSGTVVHANLPFSEPRPLGVPQAAAASAA